MRENSMNNNLTILKAYMYIPAAIGAVTAMIANAAVIITDSFIVPVFLKVSMSFWNISIRIAEQNVRKWSTSGIL